MQIHNQDKIEMEHNPPAPALKSPVTWQWQSNIDVWSNEEIEWTSYSQKLSEQLEKAYSLKVEEIDLKNGSIVNLKHMLQICKADKQHQRRVRRVDEEGLADSVQSSRKERYFGIEIPKRTYVSPFGNIRDYLNFFQNRDPRIQVFVATFTQIEQSFDTNILNNQIIPAIVTAIQREAEFLLLENKDKNIQSKNKELVELFSNKIPFSTLVEFYECILKVYTLDSFMFLSLNSLLREEDWPRLENILPYAFCLCKAFLHPSFGGHSLFESQRKSALEQGNATQGFIELYRGTAISEELLKFYDTTKIKYFSWSSVTSTTKKLDNAEFFMEKNGDNNILVLFIIQVPLDSGTCKQAKEPLIDIKPFSIYPEEEEVILAPGSIFELVKCESKAERKEITIRLVREVDQLKLQGILMQGVFNNEIGKTGRDFLLTHLEGKELEEAILHLRGNKLIERLEINSCTFTQASLKLLHKTLRTIENLKDIKLFANSSEDASFAISVRELSSLKIEGLEVYDQPTRDEIVISLNRCIDNIQCLKKLNLSFKSSITFNGRKLDILFQELEPNKELENLKLNFDSVGFLREYDKNKPSGIHALGEGLKKFPLLTSLDIDFSYSMLDDKCILSLSEGIKKLPLLTSLKIDASGSKLLTTKSLCYISESLLSLEKLESLELNYNFEESYNFEGYYCLGQGIANLRALTKLILYFTKDRKVPEIDAFSLLAGVFALKGLEYLDLFFAERCSDRLVQAILEGIATLPLLTCVKLYLIGSDRLTDKAFSNFGTEIMPLKSLTSFSLYLTNPNTSISDAGVKFIAAGIEMLDSLITLDLIFFGCKKIADNGLEDLSNAIKSLNKLRELGLNFSQSDVSDVGISDIAFEIGTSLLSLESLKLCLQKCANITDQSLYILSQQIKLLSVLSVLDLDISDNKGITDQGILFFSQQLKGLKNLNLTLDARKTEGITKEGLKKFSKEIKGHIKSSAVLGGRRLEANGQQIKYERVIKDLKEDVLIQDANTELKRIITEKSKVNKIIIEQGPFMGFWKDIVAVQPISCLNLKFTVFPESENKTFSKALGSLYALKILKLDFSDLDIKDDVLTSLAEGIRKLNMLKQLVLNLTRTRVREDGVKILFKAIRNLDSLLKLKVDFVSCSLLEGARNLFKFEKMKSRTSLLSLNLSFFACGSLSDKSIDNLFGDLYMLTSLRDFRIRFGESDLTDEILKYLSRQLCEMSSLTHLKLKLVYCENIGDAGCKYITQAIKRLTVLQILELNFSWTGLTDEGLAHFSKGVRSLGSLRKIDFRFFECEGISSAAEESLRDLLRYLGFAHS